MIIKEIYSQTCIKRSPLGQRKRGHIGQSSKLKQYDIMVIGAIPSNLLMQSPLLSSHLYLKVTFSWPVRDNFIWIGPLLRCQWPKEKWEKVKQPSTKHYIENLRSSNTNPTKAGGECRYSGRIGSSNSTCEFQMCRWTWTITNQDSTFIQ
jgi:hypothetical protein